jgi:hypothetical protein
MPEGKGFVLGFIISPFNLNPRIDLLDETNRDLEKKVGLFFRGFF